MRLDDSDKSSITINRGTRRQGGPILRVQCGDKLPAQQADSDALARDPALPSCDTPRNVFPSSIFVSSILALVDTKKQGVLLWTYSAKSPCPRRAPCGDWRMYCFRLTTPT